MQWITLPQSPTCEYTDIRAPALCFTQAIDFDKDANDSIEYLIVGSSDGISDESGEILYQYYVEKTTTHYLSKDYSFYSINTKYSQKLVLYVNKDGIAYRSWKGKLKGKPVCDFHKRVVFKFVRKNSNDKI